jgi:hypothetical protein
MRKLEELTREELIQHVEFSAGLAMGLDGLWFLAAEEATDYDRARAMDVRVWSRYGSLMVKRIRRYFKISGSGLAGLKEVMAHDPLWWSGTAKTAEDTPERLVLEVLECPALTAMEKMGRERLTCEPVETAYLEAVAAAVDPRIQVKPLKLPPRQSPEEICCRWLFQL